ncbi:PA4780 family RIO1-like protein kinase [Arenicella xantha]|uniref:non-specific serine/threonine protein kinase n=1 Tax=Arenicella xantha TaxID=644221 RepID=A0A395JKN9_9GAMM|nr:PA4780 family RIO1-like protein kinase [Arenicella xantha]RBP51271.1 RIO kinase 1 [Arenicella xantha]
MKTPKRLLPLIEDGLIDDVIGQLMSGKEATVYMVRCGTEVRCAKVYKEAAQRSFKKAVQYQEGRKVRNSRRARAMEKGSKFGRDQQEEIWQSAEVDALYKLAQAGVRVPEPYGCFSGVLLMELITDEDGYVAPRLNDVELSPERARRDHAIVMRDVVRMLCAGVIHGDLSEFNVLVDEHGPVIIDLPQAVDASANNNAKSMLERDVRNMTQYYGQFAPELLKVQYAKEIWTLFENGDLTPDTQLTGLVQEDTQPANVDAVMLEIKAALEEQEELEQRLRAAREG